jgi:hypothetical protein
LFLGERRSRVPEVSDVQGCECPLNGADSTGRCNTLITAQAEGVLQMKYRTRTYYTDSQKALMWERWKQGWTLHQIAKLFDRERT